MIAKNRDMRRKRLFTSVCWLTDVEGIIKLGAVEISLCNLSIIMDSRKNHQWIQTLFRGKVPGKQNIQMVSNYLPANYSVAKGKNYLKNGG